MNAGFYLCRPRRQPTCWSASCWATISFADPEFHKRETTLLGSRNATRADFDDGVRRAARRARSPTEALATHRASLERRAARLSELAQARASGVDQSADRDLSHDLSPSCNSAPADFYKPILICLSTKALAKVREKDKSQSYKPRIAKRARRLEFFNSGNPYIIKVQGLSGETVNEGVPVASSVAASTPIRIGRRWRGCSSRRPAGWRPTPAIAATSFSPATSPTAPFPEVFPRNWQSCCWRGSAPAPNRSPFPLRTHRGQRRQALRPCPGDFARLGLERRIPALRGEQCLWVNSLVDRIVSEPLEPAGAVAEPYALWAVENRAGLVMPCVHKDVVVTDDLKRYERLKLFLLNLSHTYMAERWAQAGGPEKMLTREWLENTAWRADLEDLVEREVQPVFDALGLGEAGARISRQRDRRGSRIPSFSIILPTSTAITRPKSSAASAASSRWRASVGSISHNRGCGRCSARNRSGLPRVADQGPLVGRRACREAK